MNQPAHPVMTSTGKARFSTAEFLRMAAVGAFDDMKVELVEGEMERMNPPMSDHADRQATITGKLWQALQGTAMRTMGEVGIDLGNSTVLACDVAVTRTAVESNRLLMPDDLLLVVEVAQTTLDRDLGPKRRSYATAGIGHYWVVDGSRRATHVFTRPLGVDYTEIAIVGFADPLAVPGTDATIVLA